MTEGRRIATPSYRTVYNVARHSSLLPPVKIRNSISSDVCASWLTAGSPGILVFKSSLVQDIDSSSCPGIGTVQFVIQTGLRYVRRTEDREEGGTQDIIGSIRAGLAFQVEFLTPWFLNFFFEPFLDLKHEIHKNKWSAGRGPHLCHDMWYRFMYTCSTIHIANKHGDCCKLNHARAGVCSQFQSKSSLILWLTFESSSQINNSFLLPCYNY